MFRYVARRTAKHGCWSPSPPLPHLQTRGISLSQISSRLGLGPSVQEQEPWSQPPRPKKAEHSEQEPWSQPPMPNRLNKPDYSEKLKKPDHSGQESLSQPSRPSRLKNPESGPQPSRPNRPKKPDLAMYELGPKQGSDNIPTGNWPFRNVLEKYNIGPHHEARSVKTIKGHGLSLSIAKRHTIHRYDMGYLMQNSSVYKDGVMKRYMDKKNEPLWWRCYIQEGDLHAVVRTKTKYRLNHAFKMALKEKSYDWEGRSLKAGRPDLQGTVNITAHKCKDLLATPFRHVLAQCGRIVAELQNQSESDAWARPREDRGKTQNNGARRDAGGGQDRRGYGQTSMGGSYARRDGVKPKNPKSEKLTMPNLYGVFDTRRPSKPQF